MIKIMADTSVVYSPDITLSNEVAALHAKIDGVIAQLASIETTLAEVRPLLSHPWVARLLKKTGHGVAT